jgi:hypothetical protein
LRAEGFSCSLDVLYGGLGITKIAIFDQKKIFKKFQLFFSMFDYLHPDPDSLEMLDPDPDPQHWLLRYIRDYSGYRYRSEKLPATRLKHPHHFFKYYMYSTLALVRCF